MSAQTADERPAGRAVQPLVEGRARLDSRRLARAAPLVRGAWRRVRPERAGLGGAPAVVTVLVGERQLALRYATDRGAVRQAVGLSRTACHFGGARPWFVCPGREGACGRRTATLYYDPDGRRFACRSCLGLAYRSQRAGRGRRAGGGRVGARRAPAGRPHGAAAV